MLLHIYFQVSSISLKKVFIYLQAYKMTYILLCVVALEFPYMLKRSDFKSLQYWNGLYMIYDLNFVINVHLAIYIDNIARQNVVIISGSYIMVQSTRDFTG